MGLLEEFRTEPEAILRFAALVLNEAKSLARSTPFACLFLPVLAEEKLAYVRQWVARQRRLSQGLAAVALTLYPQPNRRKEPAEADHQGALATRRVSPPLELTTCIGIHEHRTPTTPLKIQP
jgi:hypothetical protein